MQLQRSTSNVVSKANRRARRSIAKQARNGTAAKTDRAENVGAMAQMAEGLRIAGRLAEAENLWNQLLERFPDQPQPYLGMATLLAAKDRQKDAYHYFKRAATLAPNEYIVWHQFALNLIDLRQFEAAIVAYKKAIALKPGNSNLHLELARAMFHLDNPEATIAEYDRALELNPENTDALVGKGVQLQTLGREDEAKECFKKTIEIKPEQSFAYFRLASMKHSKEETDHYLERLKEIARSPKLDPMEKSAALFTAANMHERMKEYDEAFQYYYEGNEKLKEVQRFDRQNFSAWVNESIAGFSAETFEKLKDAANPSTSPIFILGMPRSGTTLAETIISSHPDVAAGGEERKLAEIGDSLALTGGGLNYPRQIDLINPAHLQPFGTQYLSYMARMYPGKKHTTDKLPFNFLHLGLIGILFPNATIIHCKRDPIDTCLSCYFQYFAEVKTLSFTNDMEDLAYIYKMYLKAMDHWHSVLPGRIFDIQYEELIDNQEEVSRRMIAHANLEWDDACLSFHEQERNVKTASHTQVRQPIYKSSVEKWRRYEKHIGPLLEGLKEAV